MIRWMIERSLGEIYCHLRRVSFLWESEAREKREAPISWRNTILFFYKVFLYPLRCLKFLNRSLWFQYLKIHLHFIILISFLYHRICEVDGNGQTILRFFLNFYENGDFIYFFSIYLPPRFLRFINKYMKFQYLEIHPFFGILIPSMYQNMYDSNSLSLLSLMHMKPRVLKLLLI